MAQRQLAAITFTDMAGYTALMQENEHLAVAKRNVNKAIFEESLSKYDGKLLQYYGDGTLSINTSAVNAILSAIEMQTRSREQKIDLRIGIHIGEILHDDNGVYGDSVNVASRIESLAIPGSIFISEKLYDDIKNHDGIRTKPMGYFELKNVRQPVQVYAITNDGILNPSRDEVRGKIKEISNSIAVLPFISLSSDPENEYFCDGMTEEILNVLAQIEGLQVTSRTSSFVFKNSKEDIREIAAKLNVRKILEGSVRKAGNKVRITAQLINAADGYHIWSETYDRNFEDIFELQDEISKVIANKLRINLNTSEHESPLVIAPTQNLDAYARYLEGLHFWNKQSVLDLNTALGCFEEAARLEPTFAMPYARIVNLNWFLSYAGLKDKKEAAERCRTAAAMAIKLDPDNPYTLLAQAQNCFSYEWDWPEGKRLLDKVMSINPNITLTHITLAWYYLMMMEYDKAIASMKNAVRTDPVSGESLATSAQIYMLCGKFEEALESANHALSLQSGNMYATHMKALITGYHGDWKTAIAMIEEALRHVPGYTLLMISLGIAYANNGQKEETLKIIHQIEEMEKNKPGSNYSFELTMLYYHVDDMEHFHQRYLQSIDSRLIGCLLRYNTPMMKNVRNDEVVVKSRKKLGLPV